MKQGAVSRLCDLASCHCFVPHYCLGWYSIILRRVLISGEGKWLFKVKLDY